MNVFVIAIIWMQIFKLQFWGEQSITFFSVFVLVNWGRSPRRFL